MNYDCMIIGGGIAGLTCGIKCREEGLSCAILSAGMSALHFSSGSIDLLGFDTDGRRIDEPLRHLDAFIDRNPDHPYARCGKDTIVEALEFFQESLNRENHRMYANDEKNHFHVSALGTLKPTWLSSGSVFNPKIREEFEKRSPIAILNFDGFRDFQPTLAAANLSRHRLFKNCRITTGSVPLPASGRPLGQSGDLRSIDIARIFDTREDLHAVAAGIRRMAGPAGFVGLPAVMGIREYNAVHDYLYEHTGKILYEIPTLPPSILGMRLDDALKSRFAALGGVFIAGDRVTGGSMRNGQIDHIRTKNYGDMELAARFYILATGSFFSGGLSSRSDAMVEPVFNLMMNAHPERSQWYSPTFFDPKSHPFLEYGVRTTRRLQALDASGNPVENLFCAGAVLSGYNPVREASGGGVAVAAAFHAAEQIVRRVRDQKRAEHD